MPTNQKARLRPLLMRTSKRVVRTEAARALGLNRLTNAPDLKTDLVTGVVATTGIEVMMTVEATGEEAVVAPTSVLEDGLTMEEEVDIAVDEEEEGIMTEGIIVVAGEVTVLKCGRKENNKIMFDLRTP